MYTQCMGSCECTILQRLAFGHSKSESSAIVMNCASELAIGSVQLQITPVLDVIESASITRS